MRTSLSVEGGSVCARATNPIGRRTERVEPGTSAGRQRIRPVTWITWQTEDNSVYSFHTRAFFFYTIKGEENNCNNKTNS